MPEEIIYEVIDLNTSRQFLSNTTEKIVLTNQPSSSRYYGVLVLNYMFETLKEEFPNIIDVIYNLEDDFIAIDTAVRNHFIKLH